MIRFFIFADMKLDIAFFDQEALLLAPALLGKLICRQFPDGNILRCRITETEAYCGAEDLACHASKGRTSRTEIMFARGGHVYMYLIYGMYWMMNIVSGPADVPQAVLIRGVEGFSGPGRVGRFLCLDKSFYGESLVTSDRIWIEDDGVSISYKTTPRIGIKYAGEPWISNHWRFIVINNDKM